MAVTHTKRPETWVRRSALNMKTTAELRQKLEARAELSGRSLTLQAEDQIVRSFDLEEQLALQDEIKSEMRGTIAALEQRIALQDERIATMKDRDRDLWPDAESRALGNTFSRALSAAQQVTGKSWREDTASASIVGNVVRRLMGENSRTGGTLFAELFDRERIDFLTDGITRILAPDLREALPALPPLPPYEDPANWTNRARNAVTFRSKATGELMQVVTGPEFDIADPEADREFGSDYSAALDRFRPIRDAVDAESYVVFMLKDGSTAWKRLNGQGGKIHVPAGQDAPPAEPRAEQPAALIGMEAAGADAPNWRPARGILPSGVGDQARFDEATADMPADQGEKAGKPKLIGGRAIELGPEPVPPPKRGRPRKVPA